jgi:hypothetical protein
MPLLICPNCDYILTVEQINSSDKNVICKKCSLVQLFVQDEYVTGYFIVYHVNQDRFCLAGAKLAKLLFGDDSATQIIDRHYNILMKIPFMPLTFSNFYQEGKTILDKFLKLIAFS